MLYVRRFLGAQEAAPDDGNGDLTPALIAAER